MEHKDSDTQVDQPAVETLAPPTLFAKTIGEIQILIDALDEFACENSTFESSVVGEIVRADIAAATDINTAALMPLKHKIFSFDTALKWGFFLMHAVPHLLSKANTTIPTRFNIAQYNVELLTIYDLAVMADVWEYCED